MTAEQMIERLNGLSGFDLTDAEALDLINEGYRELCARSEWLRARSTSLVTVANQEDYTLPTDLYRVLKVWVGTAPYYPTDEESVTLIRNNNLSYSAPLGSHLYWLEQDATGNDHIALYPIPTSAGDTITLSYVRRPTALTGTDEALTPREFDNSILLYAKAVHFESLEDDRQLANDYMSEFDNNVERLRRLRNSRAGRYPQRLRLAGIDY